MQRNTPYSWEEIIKKANLVHNNKYTYDHFEYKNLKSVSYITCPIHGDFLQKLRVHIKDRCGCPLCGREKRALSYSRRIQENKENKETLKILLEQKKQDFIKIATKKYGNQYDYSRCIFSLEKNPELEIICSCGTTFLKRQSTFLHGFGCPVCSQKKIKYLNKEDYIKQAKEKYGDKYDYSKFILEDRNKKVTIICNIDNHGEFETRYIDHLRGNGGCPKCKNLLIKEKRTTSHQEFLKRMEKLYEDTYDFSTSKYIGTYDQVEFICPNHGKVTMKPKRLYKGLGCTLCNLERKQSLGCEIIECFLKQNEITYKKEKTFDSCKDKNRLPFDFYLIDKNILIEYNGQQHYRDCSGYFANALSYVQKHDAIKVKWCKENNIPLIIIKYNEYKNRKELEQILTVKLL